MYIRSLSIRNLRSIAQAELDFCLPVQPQGNATLLLGGNGAGKTSILRAVALACLGPSMAESGFLPYRLVRENAPQRGQKPALCELEAAVHLTAQDGPSPELSSALLLRTNIERWGKGEARRERVGATSAETQPAGGNAATWEASHTPMPIAPTKGKTGLLSSKRQAQATDYADYLFRGELNRFVVIGYGATRRIESAANVDQSARSKSRAPRYQRVAGLFEEGVTLMPLSFWLPAFQQRNPGRAKQVATLINKLLPAGSTFLPKVHETEAGPEFMFRVNDVAVPFAALSDGFRAYVGWVADMLYHVTQGAGTGQRLDETEGIVLIDEIDLHLHPEWQREVLPTLARALPNMQFIVSSHSPLVTGSLHPQQVRVLQAGANGTSVHALRESLEGRSVDQILRSPYFGLDSTRSVGADSNLKQLALKARGGDVQASLDYLRQLAGVDPA